MPKRAIPRSKLSAKFGQLLRQARKARKVSQEELAETAGFDRTYVGMLERGESSPTLDAIFDLCEALKISPSKVVRQLESL